MHSSFRNKGCSSGVKPTRLVTSLTQYVEKDCGSNVALRNLFLMKDPWISTEWSGVKTEFPPGGFAEISAQIYNSRSALPPGTLQKAAAIITST